MEWDPQYFSNTPDACKDAPILAYHIHAIVWPEVKAQVEMAVEWQQAFMEHFDLVGKPNCTFDSADPAPYQKDICAWDIDWIPVGPFNYAQLSFHVPKAWYQPVQEWGITNRKELDILVHSKSGCDVQDHNIWA